MGNAHVYNRLKMIATKVENELKCLYSMFPEGMAKLLERNGFVGGGCIYSMFQDGKYKDIDIFFRKSFVVEIVEKFIRYDCTLTTVRDLETGTWKDMRVVITNNAISIGGFQFVKKDFGEPEDVVSRFDFKHNMFWIEDGIVKTLSNTSYLSSNKLVLNNLRPRQIAGVLVRVAKYTSRGMTISNSEMCKLILKLHEVGIEEDEMNMLNRRFDFSS